MGGMRLCVILALLVLVALKIQGQTRNAVVADEAARQPLPGASVFDCSGKAVGICGADGRIPHVPDAAYPLIVRCLGFKERIVPSEGPDTVFLKESMTELPEMVVESGKRRVLHMLAYVREYSTLSSYGDTVLLFREKMVDYMFVPDKKMRFKGWTIPRILKTKSYYRFTDGQGLDSVSDYCGRYFSWADWIGIPPTVGMSARLTDADFCADTVAGRYGPAEVWTRSADRVTVDIDVLADTAGRKWTPNLSVFFRNDFDFDNFRIRFNYDYVDGDSVSPMELSGYSFSIESDGRGHDMLGFNKANYSFSVNTYAEVYVADKEYITIKEAKKWERLRLDPSAVVMYEPPGVPELQASVRELMERVNAIDADKGRLALKPDIRLAGRKSRPQHLGQRALQVLKDVTGISGFKAKKRRERQWKEFRDDFRKKRQKDVE